MGEGTATLMEPYELRQFNLNILLSLDGLGIIPNWFAGIYFVLIETFNIQSQAIQNTTSIVTKQTVIETSVNLLFSKFPKYIPKAPPASFFWANCLYKRNMTDTVTAAVHPAVHRLLTSNNRLKLFEKYAYEEQGNNIGIPAPYLWISDIKTQESGQMTVALVRMICCDITPSKVTYSAT